MNQHETYFVFLCLQFPFAQTPPMFVFSFGIPSHEIGVKRVILLADSKGKRLYSRVVCEARKIMADAPGRVASLF